MIGFIDIKLKPASAPTETDFTDTAPDAPEQYPLTNDIIPHSGHIWQQVYFLYPFFDCVAAIGHKICITGG